MLDIESKLQKAIQNLLHLNGFNDKNRFENANEHCNKPLRCEVFSESGSKHHHEIDAYNDECECKQVAHDDDPPGKR